MQPLPECDIEIPLHSRIAIQCALKDFVEAGDHYLYICDVSAVCRSQEFHLDEQRHSAARRNFTWTDNGILPVAEILLGRATAECRQKKIRSGDERHSAASQNSVWTAKTRLGGVRFCASGRPRFCVKAEILSADDFGLPL